MITAFWIFFSIVFYTFLGYGILLYIMVRIRLIIKGKRSIPSLDILPSCTLIVPAYNEEDFIRTKIQDTLKLNYPEGKLDIIFISDGSDDKTPQIIQEYPQIKLMHEPARLGKVAALHRAVDAVKTEIIIFTDANTILNHQALINIARHYSDPNVGAVAGEKRIWSEDESDAGAAGEGFYWRYESRLKAWDSELYSVVGAAGELFSVRSNLYEPVSKNSILDDFMISMTIAAKGYRIVYEPHSYAIESASENITEELKRKIRIAAGGIQSILWLKRLLNIFKYGTLSFQYISHRVLRWTITPFLLIACLIINTMIVINSVDYLYKILLTAQLSFYVLALIGFLLEQKQLRIKILFIPYYFCVMNYAVIMGIARFIFGNQQAAWEKAKRRD